MSEQNQTEDAAPAPAADSVRLTRAQWHDVAREIGDLGFGQPSVSDVIFTRIAKGSDNLDELITIDISRWGDNEHGKVRGAMNSIRSVAGRWSAPATVEATIPATANDAMNRPVEGSYIVLFQRETDPVDVRQFHDEAAAIDDYNYLALNWSDVVLCKVLHTGRPIDTTALQSQPAPPHYTPEQLTQAMERVLRVIARVHTDNAEDEMFYNERYEYHRALGLYLATMHYPQIEAAMDLFKHILATSATGTGQEGEIDGK